VRATCSCERGHLLRKYCLSQLYFRAEGFNVLSIGAGDPALPLRNDVALDGLGGTGLHTALIQDSNLTVRCAACSKLSCVV
jgi:hypothetical protein